MRYKVLGTATVYVTVTVEAEDEDDARDKAGERFDGLTSYVGNGGTDKLVGVNDRDVSIAPGEGFDITDVVLRTL